jgi:transcriptional regulator with XRE-family HTH domain
MTSHTTNHLAQTVGANIRAARGERTQREIAMELGVSEMFVSRWERGLHTPSPDNLQRLADLFFEGDVSALFESVEAAA